MVSVTSTNNINNLENLANKIQRNLIGALVEAALNVETNAKMDCPAPLGTLRGSIRQEKIVEEDVVGFKIGSDLEYAPYVEFGTGALVSVPNDYSDFAMQFKGQKEVAGMNAQPYLLPNFEMQVELFKQNIEKILNDV